MNFVCRSCSDVTTPSNALIKCWRTAQYIRTQQTNTYMCIMVENVVVSVSYFHKYLSLCNKHDADERYELVAIKIYFAVIRDYFFMLNRSHVSKIHFFKQNQVTMLKSFIFSVLTQQIYFEVCIYSQHTVSLFGKLRVGNSTLFSGIYNYATSMLLSIFQIST